MKLIASHTHPELGDVFVGFLGQDEEFVSQGFYKMEGDSAEDLEYFTPPKNITTHYAGRNVMRYLGLLDGVSGE
ncbi:MAG: hypothetical protein V4714_08370 [Bacteroidota bacterium]